MNYLVSTLARARPPARQKQVFYEDLALAAASKPGRIALGMADDGLPVLMSLTGKTWPMLVIGDHGTGKTNLLKTMAAQAARDPSYGVAVLTDQSDRWTSSKAMHIFSGAQVDGFFEGLAAWHPRPGQRLLVIVDGLGYELHHLDLMVIFAHPRVSAVVSERARFAIDSDLEFGTLVMGQCDGGKIAESLELPHPPTNSLAHGQFLTRHQSGWMRFQTAAWSTR